MTRDELERRILNALNDDPQDPVFWSSDEIHTLIEEAIEVMAEEAPQIRRSFVVPRRPGAFHYTIHSVGPRIQAPYRIWLEDQQRRLEATSLTTLDAEHEEWLLSTGEPWKWAPVGWDQFIIWPIPVAGGHRLQVDCYCWHDPLVSGSDSPEFYEADHESIVLWGQMEGYLKQWQPDKAADIFTTFVNRWGDARYRSQVSQVSSRLWGRQEAR